MKFTETYNLLNYSNLMGKTGIKALILDYGGVISEPQNQDNLFNIQKILNHHDENFIYVYQSLRINYDNGRLSGKEFWRNIMQYYNLELGGKCDNNFFNRLISEDIKSWTHMNESMILFLKENRDKFKKLAMISNMTADALTYIKTNFQWLDLFDDLVFSCETGSNKPDPEIYDACLRRINISPQECLFVEDSLSNVGGAVRAGMHAIHFISFKQFIEELTEKYDFIRH